MVGTPGAGKSTVARELARNLGVPFVELDGIFHQPGWAPLAADEFRHRVAEVAAGDAWVIDGNYSDVRSLVWARADTVDLDRPAADGRDAPGLRAVAEPGGRPALPRRDEPGLRRCPAGYVTPSGSLAWEAA